MVGLLRLRVESVSLLSLDHQPEHNRRGLPDLEPLPRTYPGSRK